MDVTDGANETAGPVFETAELARAATDSPMKPHSLPTRAAGRVPQKTFAAYLLSVPERRVN